MATPEQHELSQLPQALLPDSLNPRLSARRWALTDSYAGDVEAVLLEAGRMLNTIEPQHDALNTVEVLDGQQQQETSDHVQLQQQQEWQQQQRRQQ